MMNIDTIVKMNHCRSCNAPALKSIIKYGETPIADKLLTDEELQNPIKFPEEYYNLELLFCENCFLTQLADIIDPIDIYNKDYPYLSSVSKVVTNEANMNANELITDRHLNQKSLVIEIASNDGYMLNKFYRKGIPVIGIEPSLEPAKISKELGIKTIEKFFSFKLADQLYKQGIRADVIIANNVLAHVPDVNDFLKGIKLLLTNNGEAVIEVHYLKNLIDKNEFDTIYHQHIYYFTVIALDKIVRRNGLYIINIKEIENYGGSIRVYLSKNEKTCDKVKTMIQKECNQHLDSIKGFKHFIQKTAQLQVDLKDLLLSLKKDGKSIAAYGAAAKANTLLHLCGLNKSTIDYIVDKNNFKHDKYMGGNHLKIEPTQHLLRDLPDYVLLLTWNYLDEIIEQESEYLSRGGKFIIPIPDLRII